MKTNKKDTTNNSLDTLNNSKNLEETNINNVQIKTKHKIFDWNLIGKTFKKTKAMYLSLLILTIVFMSVSFMSVKMLSVGQDKIYDETWYQQYKALYFGTFGLLIVGVLVALLPIMVLTQEIDNSSLTIYLVSRNSRTKVLMNKFLCMFILMFIYACFQTIIVGVGFYIVCDDHKYSEMMINTVWSYFCGGTILLAINYLICVCIQSKKNVFTIIVIITVISVLFPMMYALTGVDSIEFASYITLFIFSNPTLIADNDWKSIIPYIAYIAILPIIISITISAFNKRRLYL